MKKTIAILLAFALALCCAAAAGAAELPTLSATAELSQDKSSVTVTIRAEKNTAACGVNFTLSYDAERLAYSDWAPGAASAEAVAAFNGQYAAGVVRGSFAGTGPLPDGVLATVTFSVKKSEKETSAAFAFKSFKFADENGEKLEGTAQGTELAIPAGGSASSGGSTSSGGHSSVVIPAGMDQTVELMQFSDVKPGDWFYDSVKYVREKGLMNGTAADRFSPNATLTRAMLVTILYRMAGEPKSGSPAFSDVPSGTWYTDGVAWAASNGVVNGVGGGKFAPDASVTREQLVTMLHRYYKSPAAAGTLSFPDAGKVSAWAKNAMRWAVKTGVISGMGDGTLSPQGGATRAQVATILMRLDKKN